MLLLNVCPFAAVGGCMVEFVARPLRNSLDDCMKVNFLTDRRHECFEVWRSLPEFVYVDADS